MGIYEIGFIIGTIFQIALGVAFIWWIFIPPLLGAVAWIIQTTIQLWDRRKR